MMRPQLKKQSILIVEDDSAQLDYVLGLARSIGLETFGALTLKVAQEALRTRSFQYLLTDLHLSGPGRQDTFEGLDLLKLAKADHPEITCFTMSSDPKITTYDQAIDAGSTYMFRKPILTKDELLIHLDLAEKGRKAASAGNQKPGFLRKLPSELARRCPDGVVVSEAIRDRLRKAVNSELPVQIIGESGTGKEVMAHLFMRMYAEKNGPVPFVAVNCAHLTGDTAMSTVFGHKKGSFTGADATTTGLIGAAHGGFLYLDEAHLLTLDMQKRLLRTFQDGSYQRVGDTQNLVSSFRVIIATSKDLDEEVENGTFLLDLSTRLTGIKIKLPPLRDRLEDMPLLVELALARAGASVPRNTIDEIAERCRHYYWRGNLRQMTQVINVLVTESFGDEREIKAENLPELRTMFAPGSDSCTSVAPSEATLSGDLTQVIQHALEHDVPLDSVIETVEKEILARAFKRHPSARAVAEALNVARSTLTMKRAKYQLDS